MTDLQLWRKIERFEVDDPHSSFKFSQRLAQENSWSYEFALACILEYKKFMYLCCISDVSMTPSEAVDQVWHLHLVYTKSYWMDFCDSILGRQIHHNPTKGGKEEEEKYRSDYERTLLKYQLEFGVDPPKNHWPDSKKRFAKEVAPVKVQSLIKKPLATTTNFFVLAILLLLTIYLFVNSDSLEPWIFIFVIVVVVLAVISSIRKGGGSGGGCGSSCGSSCGHDCGSGGCGGD